MKKPTKLLLSTLLLSTLAFADDDRHGSAKQEYTSSSATRVDLNKIPSDVNPATFIAGLDEFLSPQLDLPLSDTKVYRIDGIALLIGAIHGLDYRLESDTLSLDASFVCKYMSWVKESTPKPLVDTPAVALGEDVAGTSRAVVETVSQHKLFRAMFFDRAGNCGKGIARKLTLRRCGDERLLDISINRSAEGMSGGVARIDTDSGETYIKGLDKNGLDPYKRLELVLEPGGQGRDGLLRLSMKQSRSSSAARQDVNNESQRLLGAFQYGNSDEFGELKERAEAAVNPSKSFHSPRVYCLFHPENCSSNVYFGAQKREINIAGQKFSMRDIERRLRELESSKRDAEIEKQLREVAEKFEKLEAKVEKQNRKIRSESENYRRSDAYQLEHTSLDMKRARLEKERELRALHRAELPKIAGELKHDAALYQSIVQANSSDGLKKDVNTISLKIPERVAPGCGKGDSSKDADSTNGKLGLSFRTLGERIRVDTYVQQLLHHQGPPALLFSETRSELN